METKESLFYNAGFYVSAHDTLPTVEYLKQFTTASENEITEYLEGEFQSEYEICEINGTNEYHLTPEAWIKFVKIYNNI